MKSLRNTGMLTAALTLSKSSSDPRKRRPSVRHEIALAPPASYSRARAAGSGDIAQMPFGRRSAFDFSDYGNTVGLSQPSSGIKRFGRISRDPLDLLRGLPRLHAPWRLRPLLPPTRREHGICPLSLTVKGIVVRVTSPASIGLSAVPQSGRLQRWPRPCCGSPAIRSAEPNQVRFRLRPARWPHQSQKGSADGNGHVHVSGEIEIPYGAAVNASIGRLKLVDDLNGPRLGSAG